MRETVIVNDGVKHEIGAEYFFQHDYIRDLSTDDISRMYALTIASLKLLPEHQHEEIVKTKRGLNILKQMVIDMNPHNKGLDIIKAINSIYK